MGIGTKVKINCPVYKNGRTFIGVIKGVKKGIIIGQRTLYVLIDGNSKCTAFGEVWIKEIIETN